MACSTLHKVNKRTPVAIESSMTSRFITFALGVFSAAALHAAEPEVDSSAMPRVPATPPERATNTFALKPGFRAELVASEPLVMSPVAMSFDENGRLYVVEMRDYSERRPEQLGRVRLLEDSDGDGRFDKSTVFAQDMPWPTAVICWDGGVFVGATPDILYFKDTNRDGVADVREVIFSGFASDYAPYATNKLNVQAMMNSLNWSLDNRIHGASGGSGGKVRRLDSPFTREWRQRNGVPVTTMMLPPSAVDVRGKDFSFDPRTLAFRAESGGAQHGLSFDDVGRKFVCSNSDHLQQVLYEERHIGQSTWFSLPSPRVSIAADGPAAPVYRISPDEPWRVIRTRWRVSGAVPGMIEGGGRPSGYFTGATGATIYRGDALGEEFVGDAFIADCGSNLVHRKKLRSATNSLALIGERPASEQAVEFLASSDNWFRPVQFANAPDGALYIADMYREVIEHPWSIPESLKKHLDLNSGNDRGRIYRIVREDFQQRPLPQLGRLSSAELAKVLEHPNGWHRDTAARLLYQRQEAAAVPELERVARTGATLGRMHALHALDGTGTLNEQLVIEALGATNAILRLHGLRLAERFTANPSAELVDALNNLANVSDLGGMDFAVDFQFAWTLGSLRPSEKEKIAETFMNRLYRDEHPGIRPSQNRADVSAWFLPALMNSLGNDPVEILQRSLNRLSPTLPRQRLANVGGQRAMVTQFARLIGTRNVSNEVHRTLALLEKMPGNRPRAGADAEYRLSFEFLANLSEGLEEGGVSLTKYDGAADLKNLFHEASRVAFDAANPATTDRNAAIRALASKPDANVQTNLLQLLVASAELSETRLAALSALARPSGGEFAPEVVERWSHLLPAQRVAALELLLKRPDRIRALLAGMEKGTIRASELSIAQQATLRAHRDAGIREQATTLLGKMASGSRASALERFLPALNLTGSVAAGQKTFVARCASCHRLGGQGFNLGPDLASVRSNGKEKLLTSLLDPNREVAPQFASYTIETKHGESIAGIIASESATAVLLRQANGVEKETARKNIVTMQSQGQSLMPEGLEEGLSAQDMADLLEFIVATP